MAGGIHRTFSQWLAMIIMLILSDGNLNAQLPLIHQYTELDGLPSMTLYDILQDEMGYLWIASDNGISVYDGENFRNYGPEDGLSALSIIHLYKDYKERIWGLGYNGTLSCIDDGKVLNMDYINSAINEKVVSYIDDIYIDSLERIWIAPRYGGLLRYDNDSILHPILDRREGREEYFMRFTDYNGDIFVAAVDNSDELESINGKLIVEGNIYQLGHHGQKSALHRNAKKIDENEYLFAVRNELTHVLNEEIVRKTRFEHRIIDINKDLRGNIWISVFSEGVYFYEGGDLEQIPVNYFEGETVSRTIQDFDGGYWFSTTQNGLFSIIGMDFKIIPNSYGEDQDNIISMTASERYLYYTTYNQKAYRIDSRKDLYISEDFSFTSIRDHLFDILVDSKGVVWISGSTSKAYDENGQPIYQSDLVNGLNHFELRDGRMLITTFIDMTILKNGEVVETPERSLDRRIFSIYEDNSGTIWVGSLDGVYHYYDHNYHLFKDYPVLSGKRITAITELGGFYIIGTASNGIWAFNQDSIFNIESVFQDEINKINCFQREGDSILWIGTSNGLIKLSHRGVDTLKFQQTRYQSTDGLPVDRINDLILFQDKLWIGTDHGLVCFENRDSSPIESPPKIMITSILVNDKPITISNSIVLRPKENNIRFGFKGISLKGRENVNYRFMLGSHDPEILSTRDQFVNYSNLRSGEYYFFVNAGNSNGIWNVEPNTTHIVIKKAFTETIWFYLIIIFAGISLASIIFYINNLIHRRRNKLKEEVLVMQQKLLRSQMNPHFVFNSLLSIQNFIYKNEPAIAGKYLSRFAKLIRLILNSSRKDYISLDDEIQFLNHYLDLQKLRFNERFDYKFEIDKNIKPEMVLIPPMLAQPFIENAVEHGLKNISHKGLIIIRFFLDNDTLVLEIQDNGVGIYHSEKSGKETLEKHESLGQQITTDRLRLLNQSKGKKVMFHIEELINDKHEVCGTKVSFRIAL